MITKIQTGACFLHKPSSSVTAYRKILGRVPNTVGGFHYLTETVNIGDTTIYEVESRRSRLLQDVREGKLTFVSQEEFETRKTAIALILEE